MVDKETEGVVDGQTGRMSKGQANWQTDTQKDKPEKQNGFISQDRKTTKKDPGKLRMTDKKVQKQKRQERQKESEKEKKKDLGKEEEGEIKRCLFAGKNMGNLVRIKNLNT